jgi:RND family efflux transporter MFP subunit
MEFSRYHFLLPLILLFPAALPAAEQLPCIIEPSETVEVGSPVTGLLGAIMVDRSDMVTKGQTLARISATVERKTVDLATLRTQDYSEVQSAIAAREYAKREKNRHILLYQKKLVSRQALDKAITELSLAEHKLEQARSRASQARQELKVARAQLNQRVIRSPIDGIVVERYLSTGYRVRDEPIVKIIKIDPLNVEVVVPATYYNKIQIGDTISVKPDLPGFKPRKATVKITDKVIDAASNTFRVTLEMPNKDKAIPAGARCMAKLEK